MKELPQVKELPMKERLQRQPHVNHLTGCTVETFYLRQA